jgi:thiol-disulfide isomerase/thioredoxin
VTYKPTVAAMMIGSTLCALFATANGFPPPGAPPLGSGAEAWQPRTHIGGDMPSLGGATAWLNSAPLTPADLRGKVVLVEFWTYSCINWRRESPYVRAWATKYRDRGLVVIGVHAPEFKFEEDIDNVRRAAADIGIGYPIAVDSHLAIWRAFGNEYWPALYFIDTKGRIRDVHFGEGDYERNERVLQRLLSEADGGPAGPLVTAPPGAGAEAPPDLDDLRSAENYTGYARRSHLDSVGAVANEARRYAAPAQLRVDHWGLIGDWTLHEESATLDRPGGRIAYGFHARDLHLVMGPGASGHAVRFRVTIDGRAPGRAHGVDTDEEGRGTIGASKMYQLIRQPGPITDRRFEIEFLDPGLEVYSFTFG